MGANSIFGAAPYTGTFKTVMDAISAGRTSAAAEAASKWHAKDPGDVMALVALGESLEATGEVDEAARAYGSLIDLFSSRADLRRFAGEDRGEQDSLRRKRLAEILRRTLRPRPVPDPARAPTSPPSL